MPLQESHAPSRRAYAENALFRHRFGVNYTPSRNWWFCWNDFDTDAIAKDLDAIASINLDHIRIFPIWSFFQPNPIWVSPVHLERLDMLMRMAGERGLDVCVTPLTGFLSGYWFRPPFGDNQSIYDSKVLIDAQHVYFKALADIINSHTNFLGFDLGNEINCYQSASTEIGDAWMDRILTLCEELAPNATHVNGVDHQPWFKSTTFSPAALARRQKIVSLHCWIFFTGAVEQGGALAPASVQLAAAMAALARTYAADSQKPIWVQEYGASNEWMDNADLPLFMEKATMAAIEGGVSWLTWWDSHDIHTKLQFNSLEYGLGLFTNDNKPKETALVLKEIAKTYGGRPVSIPKVRSVPELPSEPTNETTWRWLRDYIGF